MATIPLTTEEFLSWLQERVDQDDKRTNPHAFEECVYVKEEDGEVRHCLIGQFLDDKGVDIDRLVREQLVQNFAGAIQVIRTLENNGFVQCNEDRRNLLHWIARAQEEADGAHDPPWNVVAVKVIQEAEAVRD